MTKSVAVVVLLVATVIIGAAYAGALIAGSVPAWTPWALMIGT